MDRTILSQAFLFILLGWWPSSWWHFSFSCLLQSLKVYSFIEEFITNKLEKRRFWPIWSPSLFCRSSRHPSTEFGLSSVPRSSRQTHNLRLPRYMKPQLLSPKTESAGDTLISLNKTPLSPMCSVLFKGLGRRTSASSSDLRENWLF